MKKMKKIISVMLVVLMCMTTIPFAFAADAECEHDYGKFTNVCSKCYEFVGDYDLKVGENSGFTVNKYIDEYSQYTLVRFVPEKTASCIIYSTCTANTDPVVCLYDDKLNMLGYDDEGRNLNNNFELKYNNFEAGKTYYLALGGWSDTDPYTVTVEEDCVHEGTQQNCLGYLCTSCGGYFGEKDLTKHVWNANGTGICDVCSEKCTHNFVGDAENCSICNASRYKVSLTSATGVTKKYDDLAEALENAKDGDTLKLLKDNPVVGSGNYYIKNSITFDFNGHSLSTYCFLWVEKSVTFTDSVSNYIYCNCNVFIFTKSTFGQGYYHAISNQCEDASNWNDFLPECGKYVDGYDNPKEIENNDLYKTCDCGAVHY